MLPPPGERVLPEVFLTPSIGVDENNGSPFESGNPNRVKGITKREGTPLSN